jgi:hypothetical protein
MAFIDIKNPADRNKLIALGGLLLFALLIWVVKPFSGSSPTKKSSSSKDSSTSKSTTQTATSTTPGGEEEPVDNSFIRPIVYTPKEQDVPPIERNIFSYYVPPPQPTPSPTPQEAPKPPDLIVSSVSPAAVYARTGDFQLQVSGSKFVPGVSITFNGNPLPTQFVNAQQLTATVSSGFISSEGSYSIVVRSNDGRLFSNSMSFNVMAPPKPPYSYVGIIGDPKYNNDTAILKKQGGSNDLVSVKRGQTLGEWKVTAISDRAVELTHTSLANIKQTIPYTAPGPAGSGGGNSNQYPQQMYQRRMGPPPQYEPPQSEPEGPPSPPEGPMEEPMQVEPQPPPEQQ